MGWGDILDLPPDSDGGAIRADEVSITFVCRLAETDSLAAPAVEAVLTGLFGPTTPL